MTTGCSRSAEFAGIEEARHALGEHHVAVELQLAGHERGHAVEFALHQRDEVVVFHSDGHVAVGGGAFGDAGAVLTGSGKIAETVRKLRNHGGVTKYEHTLLGRNSRLDGIQAAVLSAKLTHLDDWNQRRRDAAAIYGELLGSEERLHLPAVAEGNEHVFHLYVVRLSDRDRVLSGLTEAGIGVGVHYPMPIHLLPAFGFLGQGAGSFPRAERISDEILSLSMYPGITRDDQQYVAETLLAQL